jgi:diguanylate cyclase (GGDEF)-like protein
MTPVVNRRTRVLEKSSRDEPSLARQVAARDSVRAIMWIGVLALAYSAVNTLIPPATIPVILFGDVVLGVVLILGSFLLTRLRAAPGQVAWTFAAAITTEVVWGLWAFIANPVQVHLLYLAILMTAFGPLTAAWRPFTAASVVMLAAVGGVLMHVGGKGVASWIIGMSAALAVSAVLLLVRLRSIRELESAERALVAAATHDHLTGVLNRHGLRDRVPALWADARRRGESVTVHFLDVRGLKHVNDAHGHELGDIVLQDAAQAIAGTVRGGDLVGRWGGDEFVIVGAGPAFPSDALELRLNEMFATVSQARRDRKVGEISVGRASGSPVDVDFDRMLCEADTDMYARRALDMTRSNSWDLQG